jgi:hypothetical protein
MRHYHPKAFAMEGPFASKRPCLRSVFSFMRTSTYNASSYSIALSVATFSDQDFLVMQHPPTQPYQDSSDCEKRGCLLVPVAQFTPCLRRAFAIDGNFAIQGRLRPKGVCHWRVIAIQGPLPSMRHCYRRSFGFKAPLPLLWSVFSFMPTLRI